MSPYTEPLRQLIQHRAFEDAGSWEWGRVSRVEDREDECEDEGAQCDDEGAYCDDLLAQRSELWMPKSSSHHGAN